MQDFENIDTWGDEDGIEITDLDPQGEGFRASLPLSFVRKIHFPAHTRARLMTIAMLLGAIVLVARQVMVPCSGTTVVRKNSCLLHPGSYEKRFWSAGSLLASPHKPTHVNSSPLLISGSEFGATPMTMLMTLS